jgi:hypothetical protein
MIVLLLINLKNNMKIQTKNMFIKGLIGVIFNIIFFTIFLSLPYITKAETRVFSDDLQNGGTWSEEGSPYILYESVYVPGKKVLNINKGVTIMPASTTYYYDKPSTISIYGDVNILGTKDKPITIKDLESMHFSNSNANIAYAIFDNTGLDIKKSTSTIENTIIENGTKAIYARASNIKIDHSKIINNAIGIDSAEYFKEIYLMYDDQYKYLPNTGGLGNALDDISFTTLDPQQNIITIHNSSIYGNLNYGISEQSGNKIDAINNWWGSIKGPRQYGDSDMNNNTLDMVEGLVDTTPWLLHDPDSIDVCCSNVLFIPGVEASRLYKDETGILGTSTNMLWEPNRNDDVRKMYLNENGESIDSQIYTNDIISSALFVKPIYKSFIAMINSVVADGSINAWLPFPYDWRKSVRDIVYKSTQLSTSTISLIKTVENLAEKSKTGKVIIVAHSNGGLVAKELTRALEEKGEGNIVEKIIFVAVPELGTPQAILSMLHGEGQSILGGAILSKDNARTFSQNMPSAYGLLPSKKFFENNPMNVISDMFTNNSGVFYSTYEGVKNFLLNNPFSKLISTNINEPLLLNSLLLNSAENTHLTLDKWKMSSSTKSISLMGWGLPTSEKIEYKKGEHCNQNQNIECSVIFTPIFTNDGDGTVVTYSNASTSDTSFFVNLKQIKKDLYKDIKHADILESIDILNLIKDQVANAVSATDYGKYITTTKPIDTDKYLTIKIFSPVDIDIYDKEGRHTGPIDNPVPGINRGPFEENIPGSLYGDYGGIKLVRLEYGEEYKVNLKGTDVGVFSASVDISQFNKTITSTKFAELPVTTLMNATLEIPTSTENIATGTVINIDVDGDSETDFISHSNDFLRATSTDRIADYSTYVEFIRKTIQVLGLTSKENNIWMNRIDKIEKILEKNNIKKAEKYVKKIENKKFKKGKLTSEQKDTIKIMFDQLLSKIEIDVSMKNIRP